VNKMENLIKVLKGLNILDRVVEIVREELKKNQDSHPHDTMLSSFIDSSFTWITTKEGEDYWYDINCIVFNYYKEHQNENILIKNPLENFYEEYKDSGD